MIDGVRVKALKAIPDERGWLMAILSSDEAIFEGFGEAFVTTAYPGVVKAWHMRAKRRDNLTCIRGMVKVALYDAREDSPTYKEINEFYMGERNPLLISTPPGVYRGFKSIEDETAYLLVMPTSPYDRENPDDCRLPPDTPEIPYDWVLTPGKKHG